MGCAEGDVMNVSYPMYEYHFSSNWPDKGSTLSVMYWPDDEAVPKIKPIGKPADRDVAIKLAKAHFAKAEKMATIASRKAPFFRFAS